MKTARWLAMVCPMLCVLALPGLVQAEGWGLPSWNPFASKKSNNDSGNWSLTGKKPSSSFASRKSKTSTWQKMTSGTSTAFKKTTSALNPWKTEKKTPARVTGSRRPSVKKSSAKSTWYNPTTWFSDEEPAPSYEPPGSVSEFLNQPRVPY